ncbi:replication endonuclease [Klebsiella michiganensis]|uniref:replication endonuclease n=1 Tax=Klebsiella michiganensis TaxID=1134687 RepID=UPI0013D35573|nr:replication endonuclease [Klebsiella michiganensis]MBG2579818.1 replication endonuclease [Klebsiella michiganensis]MBG2591437.1 replication endonuclease [Klebsiella michiganensis]HAT3612685.1 replication endonuclease [Klebsiella michiganensis]
MIEDRLSIADSAFAKYVFPVGGHFYNFSRKFIGEMAADFAAEISGIISGVDSSSSVLEIARDSVRKNFCLNYFSGDCDLTDIKIYDQKLLEKMAEFDLCFGSEQKNFLDDVFFENRILVSVIKKVVSRGFEFPNYDILKDFLPIRFADWDSEAVDLFYGALLRVTTPEFWEKIFLFIRSQWREARARAEGRVCKTASPYLSSASLREFIDKISSTEKFLDKSILENSDGEQIELRDAYKSGNSNPANRRRELMLRLRATDEYFMSLNYEGYFLTITAPSSYHANKINGLNTRCDCFEVRATHRYLCGIWRNVFRKFARDNIIAAGYRLVEPHHDGTPHWHCLIWFSPDNADVALKIMQNYYTKTDFGEIAGRIETRFQAVEIDPQRGAAAYAAAYVAKNIDGHTLKIDLDSGLSGIDGAQRAVAWARLHKIRQFQAFGVVGASAWREFRRVRKLPRDAHPVLADFWTAADSGDFRKFIELSQRHGPCGIHRSFTDFSGNEIRNRWGEKSNRIRGVRLLSGGGLQILQTRTTNWKIVPKNSDAIQRCGTIADAVGFQGRDIIATPWTSENNCPPLFLGNCENYPNFNSLSGEEVEHVLRL